MSLDEGLEFFGFTGGPSKIHQQVDAVRGQVRQHLSRKRRCISLIPSVAEVGPKRWLAFDGMILLVDVMISLMLNPLSYSQSCELPRRIEFFLDLQSA